MSIVDPLPSSSSDQPSKLSWPDNPYKGLSYYTSLDAALFGGREGDVRNCARVVGEEDTKVLLLHGPTGCGKSSFLRAGLIPYLESSVGRFQFLRTYQVTDAKALFIRCTEAPLQRMCEILYEWAETPFRVDLPNAEVEEISLLPIRGEARSRVDFVKKNAESVEGLIETLRMVGKLLPRTIILVIDQGEEVLTLNRSGGGNENARRFFDFLVAFSKVSIDLKIILALRKEYFGDVFAELDARRYNREAIPQFPLRELTDEQLVRAITMPTSLTVPALYLQGRKQPGEHYGFQFEAGLPKKIVEDLRDSKTAGGLLPVLQITCDRLYRSSRKAGLLLPLGTLRITHSDYMRLGPLDTQVRQFLDDAIQDGIVRQLPSMSAAELAEERERWKDVLYSMVHKGADNTALSRIRTGPNLELTAKKRKCQAKFSIDGAPKEGMGAFLSHDDRRVLRKDPRPTADREAQQTIIAGQPAGNRRSHRNTDDRGPDPVYYSLGHDALAVDLDTWGAARTVLLRRRDYFTSLLQTWCQLGAFYLCLGAAFAIYLGWFDGISVGTVTIVLSILMVAGGLWAASDQIAEKVMEVLIRRPAFQRVLTNPPQ